MNVAQSIFRHGDFHCFYKQCLNIFKKHNKLIHKLYILKIFSNFFLGLVATTFKEIFKGFEKKHKKFLPLLKTQPSNFVPIINHVTKKLYQGYRETFN